MALIDGLGKGPVEPGLVASLGVLVLAPTVVPVIGQMLRPLAQFTLSAGIVLYRHVSEQIGGPLAELVAGAQQELAQSSPRGTADQNTTDRAPNDQQPQGGQFGRVQGV